MMRAGLSLSLALAAGIACSSNHPTRPFEGGAGISGASGAGGTQDSGVPGPTVVTFDQTINRNVDVLFMIDNSSDMVVMQTKLAESFSAYTDALKLIPGGLPNLHLAVVSSSLGAGTEPNIRGCAPGGDQGIFQSAQRGNAAAPQAASTPARASSSTPTAPPRTSRATSPTRSTASPPSAIRAAASSTSSRPCCARSAPTARPHPPRTPASCALTPTCRSSS